MNAGGASRHLGIAGAVDWPWAFVTGIVGASGGILGAALTRQPPVGSAVAGAILGLAGAVALRARAASAGSGLIWGLGGGFLLWAVLAAAGAVASAGGYQPEAMLAELRGRIPGLAACILLIGAPVGLALGVRGALGPNAAPFHWGRAITAGVFSGFAAAMIFSRWMYEGDFFPLIGGIAMGGHTASVVIHFAAACLIGCTFGILFQNDVKNLGSSMGLGMAYAVFWWFLGSMTLVPMAKGLHPDWSAANAGELFGPLVGHIFYGLILGVVYSGVNSIWTRLFVDSDPLNRRREGPGIRLAVSLGWGLAAGSAGGVAALPYMIQTGVITKLAGLDSGVALSIGVCLHLALSATVGASYGILFRGESSDAVSSSLWGFMLGLIGWYAGPLTLLPLLRTGECDWRPEAAAALLPSLVGHLLFGLVTANIFSAFERAARKRGLDARNPSGAKNQPEREARPTAPLCLFALGVGILLPILLS
ncbi:MAG: hypothetical protein WAN79_07690 [Opitutaceae bacterium]|jgi:hypothetical protein